MPFIEVQLVENETLEIFVQAIFSTDRHRNPKGMVEVLLMSLESNRELEATREKLRLLEQHYDELRRTPTDNEHLRELTLRSLRRFINQLQEEIARFESRAATRVSQS